MAPEGMTGLVRRLMRARARLARAASAAGWLPPDLEEARTRLGELDRGDRARQLGYYSLLYDIGLVLSESRRPLSMSELSRALAVSVSTATRIVDWQVRHGYVERRSDPKDRRRVLVALTPHGQALYDRVEKFLAGLLARGLRRFSRVERKQLAALLEKLVEDLAEKDA